MISFFYLLWPYPKRRNQKFRNQGIPAGQILCLTTGYVYDWHYSFIIIIRPLNLNVDLRHKVVWPMLYSWELIYPHSI